MTTQGQIPSLMDEYPLLVYPSLAEAMGINKAVVFQQLHFLLCNQKTARNEYVFVNDRWWVYNTYKEWKETYFSWLTTVTLQRLFTDLEADGLVLTMQSVKNKSDRRKWYTIDYQAWESYQNTIVSKRHNEPSYQNDTMVISKRYDGYSETPTETPTEKKPRKSAGGGVKASSAEYKRQEGLARYEATIAILLKKFKPDVDWLMMRPCDMPAKEIEKYIEVAQVFEGFNHTADDLPGMFKYLDAKGWPSYGVGKVAECAPDYAGYKSKYTRAPASADPDMDLSIQQPVTPILLQRPVPAEMETSS